MTLRPKTPRDLLLAPVAAEVDQNLQSLRDKSPAEIGDALGLVLNVDRAGADRRNRPGSSTQRYAVELHSGTRDHRRRGAPGLAVDR
jgi:hypothetical protein